MYPCLISANVPLLIDNRLRILRGFRASVNHTFEGRILDFIDGIPDFMDNFNTF